MPIGTSDGEQYDDELQHVLAQPYRGPNLGPLSPEGKQGGTGTDKTGDIDDRRNDSLIGSMFSGITPSSLVQKAQDIYNYGPGLSGGARGDAINADENKAPETPLGDQLGYSDLKGPAGATAEPTGAFNSQPGTPVASDVQASPAPSYSTPLSVDEAPKYQEWKQQYFPNDTGQDYDLQGAFKGGVVPAENGHGPDTYKMPNHMTFSDESVYHGVNGNEGGHWGQDEQGNDTFTPGRTNLEQHSMGELQDYFKRVEPNAKLLPPDIDDVPHHDWVENIFKSAKEAFQLPGDVFNGTVPSGSQQELERAADLAGLMTFGPAPVASKMADGTLGSFMGVKSKTINKDKLYQAQNMKSDGVHPDDIWAKTGTFQGADQRWRQEIPDNTAVLRNENLDTGQLSNKIGQTPEDGLIGLKPTYKGYKETNPKTPQEYEDFFKNVIQGTKAKPMNVEDVFHHPDLFAAYPHLGKIPVKPIEEYRGGINTKNVLGIHVHGDAIYMARQDDDGFKSVLLHELQHAIQEHEGFARGGNSGMFLPEELSQAEKEFKDIKTEIEPQVKEELGLNDKNLAILKEKIRIEKQGNLNKSWQQELNQLKENYPLSYKRLSNIVNSEDMIQEAKDNAFESYKRLAGEVESRNVEDRRKMNRIELQRRSPIKTQDRPTFSQIFR